MDRDSLNAILDINKSIFVDASAGTGKTFALTQRYCAIIDHFYEEYINHSNLRGPRDILVITFTRKAATEMYDRIYQELTNVFEGRNTSFDYVFKNIVEKGIKLKQRGKKRKFEYFKEFVLRDFSSAPITTIDAFGYSLLKESYKDGLPFVYSIDPDKKRIIFYSEIDNFFKEIDKGTHLLTSKALSVIEKWSYHTLKSILMYILENFSKVEKAITRYQKDSDSIEKMLEKIVDDYFPGFQKDKLLGIIEEIVNTWNPSLMKEDVEVLLNEYLNSSSLIKKLAIAGKITSLFFKNDGSFYSEVKYIGSKLFKKFFSEYIPQLEDIYTRIKEIHDMIFLLKDVNLHAEKEARALILTCFDICKHIKEKIDLRLNEEKIIGLEDIIEEGLKLKDVKKTYLHILIDEFQDTNEERFELVKKVANENTRWFIVGDMKQSIYKFNGTDVSVFKKGKEFIKNNKGEVLQLQTNRRSCRMLIEDFINPFFTSLMSNVSMPYEATYSPVNSSRDDPSWSEIKFFLTSKEFTTFSNEYLVCLAVKEALEKLKHVEESPKVAVLFRTTQKMAFYQSIMAISGIESQVFTGESLFESLECMDIICLLKLLLDDREAGYEWFHILRSPFFSLPDKELLEKKEEIFSGNNQYSNVLKEWRRGLKFRGITNTLISILKETGYENFAAVERGEVSLVNIYKLIDIISQYEKNGFTLKEIIEVLQLYQETKASSKVFLPAGKDVILMTVHSSKGLEFPAVVLTEINFREPYLLKDGIVIEKIYSCGEDGKYEIGIKTRDENMQTIKNFLGSLIVNSYESQNIAEMKRLLYVALTRAKDILYICSDNFKVSKNSRTQSRLNFFKMLNDYFNFDKIWKEKFKNENEILFLHKRVKFRKVNKEELLSSLNFSSKITPSINIKSHSFKINPIRILENNVSDILQPEIHQEKGKFGKELGSIFHYFMEIFDTYTRDKSSLMRLFENYLKDLPYHYQEPLYMMIKNTLYNTDFFSYHHIKEKRLFKKFVSKEEVLFIRGIADLIVIEKDKIKVIDYKTNIENSSFHKQQVRCYMEMVKWLYPEYKKVEGFLYYPYEDKLIEVEDFEESILTKYIPNNYMETTLNRAQNNYYISYIKDILNNLSAWCPLTIITYTAYKTRLLDEVLLPVDIRLNIKEFSSLFPPYRISNIERLKLLYSIVDKYINPLSENRGLLESIIDAVDLWMDNSASLKAPLESDLLRRVLEEYKNRLQESKKKDIYYIGPLEKGYPGKLILEGNFSVKNTEKKVIEILKRNNIVWSLEEGENRNVRICKFFSPFEEIEWVVYQVKKYLEENNRITIIIPSPQYEDFIQRKFLLEEIPVFRNLIRANQLSTYSLLKNIIRLFINNTDKEKIWEYIVSHPLYSKDEVNSEFYKKIEGIIDTNQEITSKKVLDIFKEIVGEYIFELPEKKILEELELYIGDNEEISVDVLFCMLDELFKEYVISCEYREGVHIITRYEGIKPITDILFILGFNNKFYPLETSINPFLKIGRDFYPSNKKMFLEWLNVPTKNTYITYTENDFDFISVGPSIFLLDKEIPKLIPNSWEVGRTRLLSRYTESFLKKEYSKESLLSRYEELKHTIPNNDREYAIPTLYMGKTNYTPTNLELNVNKLETIKECPLKYLFQYVLEVPGPEEIFFYPDKAKEGEIIHNLMCKMTEKGILEGIRKGRLDFEELKDSFAKFLSDIIKEENLGRIITTHLRRYENRNFLSALFNIEKQYPIDIEEKVEVPLEIKEKLGELSISIKCRLDRIIFLKKNKKRLALIIDYKTGTVPSYPQIKRMENLQMPLYVFVARQKYSDYILSTVYVKISPDSIEASHPILGEGALLEDFPFLNGRTPYKYVEGPLDKEERTISLNSLQDKIKEIVSPIVKGEFAAIWGENRFKVCKDCVYKYICRFPFINERLLFYSKFSSFITNCENGKE